MIFNPIKIYQRSEKTQHINWSDPDPTRFLLKGQTDPTRSIRTRTRPVRSEPDPTRPITTSKFRLHNASRPSIFYFQKKIVVCGKGPHNSSFFFCTSFSLHRLYSFSCLSAWYMLYCHGSWGRMRKKDGSKVKWEIKLIYSQNLIK
jgi:hypothetical protein